jgi:hypothetical protein
MVIEQLGSLGELVAGIATIATLFYLALQIRENTKVQKRSANREVVHNLGLQLASITENEQLAKLLLKGWDDLDSLDAVERLQFDMHMARFINQFDVASLDYEAGVYDEEPYQALRKSVCTYLSMPGGEKWWQENSSLFTENTRTSLNSMLDNPAT